MATKFKYETCCVALSSADVDDLRAMTDAARDVSYSTFTRQCDWQEWARDLSYEVGASRGLHLKDDCHVGFYRSTWRGRPCYFATHSAIEHIFTGSP